MTGKSLSPRAMRRTPKVPRRARRFGVAAGTIASAATAAAASLFACAAHAQTWVGPGGGVFSGSFNTASNWTPAAVPQPTSTATFSLNQTYTVTFAANVTTSSLFFSNSTGVTTFGTTGTTRTYTVANSASFSGGTATLGNLNLNVQGNFSTVQGNLFRVLGASSLTASTLGVATDDTALGATLSVEGDASRLTVLGNGSHNVGRFGGTGTLTFSNSALGSVAGTLALGDHANASGGKGFLNVLSGADVTLTSVRGATGNNANQTAGLSVQGAGSTLTFADSSVIELGGSSSSTAAFDVLGSGTLNLQRALLNLHPTATMTVNRGTVSASALLNVAGLLTATNGARFTHSGTSSAATLRVGVNIANILSPPPSPSTVNVGGAATTFAAQNLRVGIDQAGTFNQSGGAVTLTGFARLGSDDRADAPGTYQLAGGTLNSQDVLVGGARSAGFFVHSAGSHTLAGRLRVAANLGDGELLPFPGPTPPPAATYTLTGGAVAAQTLWVGNSANGIVNHSGGSVTVANELTLGGFVDGNTIIIGESNATGAYNLSGATATVSAAVQRVGWTAPGTFTQSGGTNTVTSRLVVGEFGTGAYALSAGTLTAPTAIVNKGTFDQTGGAATFADLLDLASSGQFAAGAYTLRGGTLAVPTLNVSAKGAASFDQRGGAATVTTLLLGADQGTQRATASLAAGTLHASTETVGRFGDAKFTQSGGTNLVDARLTIGAPASPLPGAPQGTGEYVLSGGVLSAAEILVEDRGLFTFGGKAPRLDAPNLVVRGAFVVDSLLAPTLAGNATFAPGSSNHLGVGLNLAGTATLQAAVLHGDKPLVLDKFARLRGSGAVFPSVDNAGTIEADAGTLVLRGPDLSSTGTLRNAPGASLFVKAAKLTNTGHVAVSAGGTVAFDQPLRIESGKTLTLAGGALATPLLTNATGGSISGFGQVTADVDNAAAATFVGPTQFVGNFTNRPGATLTVRNDQLLIAGVTTNNGTINTVNGKVVFEAPLASATPAGLLTSVSTSAPATTPPGGGLEGAGSLTLSGASTLVTSYVRQQALTLSGTAAAPAVVSIRPKSFGGQTSVVSALSIPAAGGTHVGRLDLADTALIVDYATATPLASVRAALAAGFNGGDWLGNGITSSAAALDRSRRALGYAEASALLGPAGGTFVDQPVDATAVLVRFTVAGDANLDARVNFSDLLSLAKHYNQDVSGSPVGGWSRGDFNYDDRVNFNDLLTLARNYNAALPTDPVPGAPLGFEQDLAAAFAQVPEPSTPLLLAATACGFAMSTRRRRRKGA